MIPPAIVLMVSAGSLVTLQQIFEDFLLANSDNLLLATENTAL